MPARIVFALIAAFCPLVTHAQEKLTAAEIVDRAQAAFYSPGADMKARVVMDLINADGKKRTRVLSMLRKNIPGGREQRYFLYFHEPGDVRRTAFLVWKYPEKDDDRWIFIPAVNMTRRIAARDSRSSFVGSDFSYEDISGRDLAADSHTVLREEKLSDATCYVVQSTPKAAADFSRKLSWIDKTSWLPLNEEYYDAQNQLARVFTADRIEAISAGGKTYPTVVKRTMKNVQSGHRTEVVFESVAYDVGIPLDIFTERSLQQAPEKWIR
jgi:outer membrane lipoprotein-sorting protein